MCSHHHSHIYLCAYYHRGWLSHTAAVAVSNNDVLITYEIVVGTTIVATPKDFHSIPPLTISTYWYVVVENTSCASLFAGYYTYR